MTGESDQTRSPLLKPLRALLSDVDLQERKRILNVLLADIGDQGAMGDSPPTGEQLTALRRKTQSLESAKASLEDSVRVIQSDLERSESQLRSEQARATELRALCDQFRQRLTQSERRQEELEAELVSKNGALHQAEVRVDELSLQIQRADLKSGDRTHVDRLQKSQNELQQEFHQVNLRMEELRRDKNAEISRLTEELSTLRGESTGAAGEKVLGELWQRLARTKPALSEGHVPPTVQAAERLVDSFIELARFVDEMDKGMRVFLNRYTKYNQSVKVPWEAYTKGDDLYTIIQRTIAPQGGRPVGPLKLRLRLFYSWVYAGMVGCDSAIESLGSELHAHLMGSLGTGQDANRKVRDYVRDDGHLLFAQHVAELRSQRLAETYGRG